MKTFFAFEVMTECDFIMWVDLDESAFESRLDDTIAENKHIEKSLLVGTVEASNIKEALNKIRSGDWEITRKMENCKISY